MYLLDCRRDAEFDLVHTARPTSNLSSLHHCSPHHSLQARPQKRHSFSTVVAVDHALFRKHIVQSHSSSFGGPKMLAPNNTKNNTLPARPKPRPLVEQDFEVIGLSDDFEAESARVRPPPGAARRTSSSSSGSGTPIRTRLQSLQNGSTPSLTGRDLLTGKARPSLPLTQSSPALGEHLALPVRTSRRKKSPTRIRDPASRHSSPSPPSPRSVSLNFQNSNGKVHGLPTLGSKQNGASGRRSSWQPGRKSKTVEEIEKECDEDDDDEIPEDTVFWNIPLSPRAGRSLPSGGSKSPSPERLSETSSPPRRNSEVNGTPKTDRATTPTPSQSTVSLPSLARSESGDSEPRGRLKFRGKSWGDVMLELGNDAKELTEALERYADESIEAQEKELQKRVKATRNLSTSPPTRDEVKIALPPKQVSDSIMGALPMSKEKEAALSRTRPGWLPPKSKHEEEKHLKEYQEMMRLSIESDRRRAEKERLEAANREKQREAVHKTWDDKILPNWNQAILEQSTRELWWAGVSPKSRGIVWQRAIGNALKVSEETYNIALERAKKLEAELNASEDRHPQKDQFGDIRKDADNTFTELKLFQAGGPLHQSLVDVLMAYSVYRKDVGYIFGLHAIAANLLLNLSAADTFQTLANLLNRQLPLSFYTQDEQQVANIYNAFLRTFQYKLPSLYQHIHIKLQIPPPLYLEAMFTTLFTLHVPIDIVSRLWDVYAFEGDAFLIRTAVAVLTILESRLYGTAEEVVALLGWEGTGCMDKGEWRLGKEDEFMTKVRGAGKVEVD
ncbi:Drainin [Drechslerella dactyloides]|uniref:Drainin n=1 Tax=Drechslerella dactyloides TaxID=74499 RepID=A0AAD6NKA3_DREDA|nr:Drainin [Drechslerella dactyloides]